MDELPFIDPINSTTPAEGESSSPSADPEPVPVDKRDTFPEYAELPEGDFGKPKMVRLKDRTYPEKFGHKDITHPVRLAAIARAAEIYDLRLQGWSLRELAHEFKVSAAVIHRILVREANKIQKKANEGAEYLRTIMEERLDFMWKSLYPQIAKGNFRASEMGLKIMERQAKLRGLDAPEKKEIDLNIGLSDAELVAQARRLNLPVPQELESLTNDGPIINAEFSIGPSCSSKDPEGAQGSQESEGGPTDGSSLPDDG